MALAWQPIDLVDDPDDWVRGDPADRYDLPDLTELLERPAWHRQAACRGKGEMFYLGRGQPIGPAVAICDGCPVRSECLDAALDLPQSEDYGIWGGTSAQHRRRMRYPAA